MTQFATTTHSRVSTPCDTQRSHDTSSLSCASAGRGAQPGSLHPLVTPRCTNCARELDDYDHHPSSGCNTNRVVCRRCCIELGLECEADLCCQILTRYADEDAAEAAAAIWSDHV